LSLYCYAQELKESKARNKSSKITAQQPLWEALKRPGQQRKALGKADNAELFGLLSPSQRKGVSPQKFKTMRVDDQSQWLLQRLAAPAASSSESSSSSGAMEVDQLASGNSEKDEAGEESESESESEPESEDEAPAISRSSRRKPQPVVAADFVDPDLFEDSSSSEMDESD
jgi:hypothetical protein